MAVSIDRVYQKVLTFANKEQRGYITPQEFNLFANQAQMEIFEQYFYDINQWSRQHGSFHEYSDPLSNLEDKISLFERIATSDNITVLNKYGDVNLKEDLPDLYRLGSIRIKYPGQGYVEAEEMRSRKEFMLYNSSPLAKQSRKRPTYYRSIFPGGQDRVKIYPYPVDDDGSDFDLTVQNRDTSINSVTVTSITHSSDGSNLNNATGKWMLFDVEEMYAFLGKEYENQEIITARVLRTVHDEVITVYEGEIWLISPNTGGQLITDPTGGTGAARKHPLIREEFPAGTPYRWVNHPHGHHPDSTCNACFNDWKIGDEIVPTSNIYLNDRRNVQVDYIRKPKNPNWGFVVVNDKALYNSSESIDFELHQSEESELVYRILAYAGIAIEKPQLTQMAAGLEQAKVQQEKQ